MAFKQTLPRLNGAELADYPISICLLGQFRLFKSRDPVRLKHGGRSESLLTVLALHAKHGVGRERLLQALWPQTTAALAGHCLNTLVYNLHNLLGDSIAGAMPVLHFEGKYQLNVEAGVAVDVVCFDKLVLAGDRAAASNNSEVANSNYEQALELYCGDLSSGNDLTALVERERLRATYLTLLAKLADFSFAERDYGECLGYAQRLLEHDPCREDAHRLIMRCYVRQGMRAQALRQYQLCMHALRLEFDVQPEPITLKLFEEIRLDPTVV